jgi:hypothetical protein
MEDLRMQLWNGFLQQQQQSRVIQPSSPQRNNIFMPLQFNGGFSRGATSEWPSTPEWTSSRMGQLPIASQQMSTRMPNQPGFLQPRLGQEFANVLNIQALQQRLSGSGLWSMPPALEQNSPMACSPLTSSRPMTPTRDMFKQSFQISPNNSATTNAKKRLSSKSMDMENNSAKKVPKKNKFSLDKDDDEESDETDADKAVGEEEDEESKERSRKHNILKMPGESRLRIAFDSLGTKGKVPQCFGKRAMIIPDGIRGSYTIYGEHWEFSINHGAEEFEPNIVCITWSIKHLATGIVYSSTETKVQAKKRASLGNTICNKVFRNAMSRVATSLEQRLATEPDESVRHDLQATIQTISPRSFSDGLLVFGLKHRGVQVNLLKD